jgi:exonuclease VII large subunit
MKSSSLSGRYVLLLALVALLMASGSSASAPKPQPTPTPRSAAEKLLADLTDWLKLDAAQQEKTRGFVAELLARNQKVKEDWQRTKKPRPEDLAISRGQFEKDLFSILTPEQKKIYAQTARQIMAKGHTAPTRPGS